MKGKKVEGGELIKKGGKQLYLNHEPSFCWLFLFGKFEFLYFIFLSSPVVTLSKVPLSNGVLSKFCISHIKIYLELQPV